MALVRGTLDVLVLKALSWTPMHAFEIARWLEDRSAGQFTIEDAALMQALHRLEERRLLAAEWGVTENGRRARYYRLTSQGRAHLREETERLTDYVRALTSILALRRSDT
jgi:transcriptional regulator